MTMPRSVDELLFERLDQQEELAKSQSTFGSRAALVKELQSLNLYNIAVNLTEERDPKAMGQVEKLLRAGDTEGLKALLGPQAGEQLQQEFLKVWKQASQDKEVAASRNGGEIAQDIFFGVPIDIVNTIWAGEILVGGMISPEYARISAERNREYNETNYEMFLSPGLQAKRKVNAALDAQDERENELEAQRAADEARGQFLPTLGAWSARVAKDAADNVGNLVQDPGLLGQELSSAATSMGSAAVLKKGLETTGKAVLKSMVRESAEETAETLLKKIGERTLRGLDAASWAGANAALEGTGAYRDTVTSVLLRPTDELFRTSEEFRNRVAELVASGMDEGQARSEAQSWLAHKAGLAAAAVTGLTAAGISHVIGQPGKAPTKIVTGSLTRDVIEEGIEEGLQGASGTMIGNQAIQQYVDRNTDTMKGVGGAIGEGIILGMGSAGAMKVPGAIVHAPVTAGNVLGTIADKRLAKAAAEARASTQNLMRQADNLIQDGSKIEKLGQQVDALLTSPEMTQSIVPVLNELVGAAVVEEQPESFHALELNKQQREMFTSNQNRVQAIDHAAKLLLAETDPAKQEKLAVFLSDLMEPVRRFQEVPSEFEPLAQNAEVMAGIQEFRQILTGIAQLPTVVAALSKVNEVLGTKPKTVEINTDTLSTPEGQQAAKALVAHAMVNPNLSENTTSKEVKTILTHGTDGKGGGVNDSQRKVLEGALRMLEVREKLAKVKGPEKITQQLQKRHLIGQKDAETVGDELTIDQSPFALEDGKYSAKQHTDRVIKAMGSGNKALAKKYLEHFTKLAQHQFNKVEALNKSYRAGGKRFSYMQLLPNGKFVSSETNPEKHRYKEMYVQSGSAASVENAQTIAYEANLLLELVKGLNQAYPEIAVELPKVHGLAKTLLETDTTELAKQQETKKEAAKSKPAPTVEVTKPVEKKEAPAPKQQPKNEVKEKNEVRAEPVKVEAKEPDPVPEKTIADRVLESLQDKTESISFLVQKFFGLSEEEQLKKLYLDVNTGGLNARAFEDLPGEGLVAHISIEGTKYVNDNAGHDKGNDLYREAGRALSKANPLVAKVGGDFAVRVKNQAELDKLLKTAQSEGKLHGLQFTGAIGSTLKQAQEAHTALKKSLEESGKRAARGEKPKGFKGNVKKVKFGNGEMANVPVPDVLRQKFAEQMKNPTTLFKRIYIEDKTGILTGEAFHDLPPKKHQASIDLNWLKQINTLGEVNGDKALRAFGSLAHKMGGLEVDFAHVSGDEYLAQSNDLEQLKKFLEQLSEEARQAELDFVSEKDGNTYILSGLLFGYGIGADHAAAEAALNVHKQQLEDAGLRGKHATAAFEARLTRADAGVDEGGAQVPAGKGAASEVRGAGSGVELPTNLAERFPQLVQVLDKVRNFFHEAFEGRKNATRLQGIANPFEAMLSALANDQNIRNFFGEAQPKQALTPEIRRDYSALISQMGTKVQETLQANLDEFLSKVWSNGITWEQALREGHTEVTIKNRGKTINLVELDAQGKFKYNSELIQQAILAGLQWQLTASQREVPVWKQDDEASDILDIESTEGIPEDVLRRLGAGESLDQAKLSLANTIRRFWGVRGVDSHGIGLTDGIPEAMAAELLRAFEDLGLVQVDRFKLSDVLPDHEQGEKNVARYTAHDWGDESQLYAYPELIEEMVVLEPEHKTFYGDQEVPVLQTQLANPQIPVSERTQTAVKNMQQQQFFLNLPMVRAFFSMDGKGLIELFGNVLPEKEDEQKAKYNKNDLASKQGQNLSLLSALKELRRIYTQMQNIVEAEKAKGNEVSIDRLGKKFQYAVTSVNRIMMQGAHNPQASKLMREALLPTWSNLSLEGGLESTDYQYLMLALAQALGQKIHRNTFEANVHWAHNAINNELVPVLELLGTWLKDQSKPFPTTEFKKLAQEVRIDGKGIDITPLSLMTLTEIARMKQATPEELRDFRTPIYLESDGMTNGPFNAMGLLTVGEFTEEWVTSVRRGGLSIGQGSKTANELVDADNYKASMDAAQTEVETMFETLAEQGDESARRAGRMAHQLFTAMHILLDGDVKWTRNDEGKWQIVLERGLGKNPITVLIYGSGINGISNKIGHKLTTAFYEKLSVMAQSKTEAEGAQKLFPDLAPAAALARWNELRMAMEELTTYQVSRKKDRSRFWLDKDKSGTPSLMRLKRPNGYQQFTFDKTEQARLQTNLRYLLVEPMRNGIEKVLGKSMFDSGTLLAKATQIQSITARALYLKAIEDKVGEKVAKLTEKLVKRGLPEEDAAYQARNHVSSEFLSRKELEAIWNSLWTVMPVVNSDNQNFLVAKTALLQFWEEKKRNRKGMEVIVREASKKYQYSRSLDDKRETRPFVKAIENSEVAAIPYLTIGMGDARMVREIFQTAFDNSMQVFDGINIPVNRIPEYGSRINEAAFKAWHGNVFRDMARTFQRFMNDKRVAEILKNDPKLVAEILKSTRSQTQDLEADLKQTLEQLNDKALQMEARQNVLARYQISIDQMAGTYRPFVSEGRQMPQGATERDIAEQLTNEYHEELAKLRKDQDEKNKLPHSVFGKPARRHKSGAWVLTKTAILELPRMLKGNVTKSEWEVLGEIIRSGSLGRTKIVAGTRAEIARYQEEKGLSSLATLTAKDPTKTIHGYYAPHENTIYLMNPKVETLLHELIHASTYNTVEAYYAGRNLGPNADQVKGAIQRLENLMKVFLETDFNIENESVLKAMQDAKVEIRGHMPLFSAATPEQKAAALNEFMAWTLANHKIATELSGWMLTEGLSQESIDKQVKNLPPKDREKVRQELEKTSPSRLAKLVKTAYETIKRLIWGRKTAPSFGSDITSQIRFNTAILSRLAPTIETQIREITLAHAVLNGTLDTPTRLAQIRENFARRVARSVAQAYTRGWQERIKENVALTKQNILATKITEAARAKLLFPMDDEAASTFHMMVLAFASAAEINPHAMIEAQKLYEHFLSTVDERVFMTGQGAPEADIQQAVEKFEFLSGHTLRATDAQGRSTLLPVFMALATVHEDFRAILSKLDLPKSAKTDVIGMDTAIEAAGNKVLEGIEAKLAGINHPPNIRAAIDQLNDALLKETLKERNAIQEKLSKVNKFAFDMNAKLANLLKRLGRKGEQFYDETRDSDSEFVQKLGTTVRAMSALASDESAEAVSEELLAQMDKWPGMWQWVRDFMGPSGLIGRTTSQAKIYDMVKRIRSTVQQTRQNFRDKVPAAIIKQFKQKLTPVQWDSLYRFMGRYDLASLLEGRTVDAVLALAGNREALAQEIARLENELRMHHPNQAARYMVKIDQYVNFVQTGVRNPNLLRNAYAISQLLGEKRNEKTWVDPSEDTIKAIDQLITLKLLDQASDFDREVFTSLTRDELHGMQFVLNYLKGLRKTEMEKARTGMARYNHYKGLLPSDNLNRGHIRVTEDTEDQHRRMLELGYVRIAPYKGSNLEPGKVSRSYYYSPEGGARTTFTQGIAQNVQHTAYGVHLETGWSSEPSGGLITDPVQVAYLRDRLDKELAGTENLSPIYDSSGDVIAFERSLDPKHMKKLEQPQNLAQIIGQWRGRQAEEIFAFEVNRELVNNLHEMWEKDDDKSRYIDLFDTKNLDPVIRDAVNIFPHHLRVLARSKFGGNHFYVRRNLVEISIGYRNASVGDFWTGTTRHSKPTQEIFRKSMIALLGVPAYRKLVWAEKNWQAAMHSVRTNIVVRSLVVPAANFVSGLYQLRAHGVPLFDALKKVPAKVAEVEFYTKSMTRKIELEAELFANENNVFKARAIQAQLRALDDSLKRLSIWPLIEAGEFSSISDVGQTAEDLGVGPNDLINKLEDAIDKLPPGLRDFARQGYIARDTALFQVLQKSVQYSDFVMKAIYFDHITKIEKKSPELAKARVTEAFNNYDLPTGRTRGYVESMGLAWFLNYKIRASKIALSMIRNNPLDLLLYMALPHPFANGIPVTDNLFASLFEGTLGFSLGPNMAMQPIGWNPWYNLIAD